MKYFRFAFILALLGSFSVPEYLFGQNSSTYSITTENGLPSSHVYGYTIDKMGYLWIATANGVVRYNGYDCRTFDVNDGLPKSDVWDLVEDTLGQMWLGTIGNEMGYIKDNTYHKVYLKGARGTVYPQYMIPYSNGVIFSSPHIGGSVSSELCFAKNDTVKIIPLPENLLGGSTSNPNKRIISKILLSNTLIGLQVVDSIYPCYYYCDSNGKFSFKPLPKLVFIDPIFLAGQSIISHSKPRLHQFSLINIFTGKIDTIDIRNYGCDQPINYITIKHTTLNNAYLVYAGMDVLEFSNTTLTRKVRITNDSVKPFDQHSIIAFGKHDYWGDISLAVNSGIHFSQLKVGNFNKLDFKLQNNSKYLGNIARLGYWWDKISSSLKFIDDKNFLTTKRMPDLIDIYTIFNYCQDTVLLGTDLVSIVKFEPHKKIELSGIRNPGNKTFKKFVKTITNEYYIASSVGLGRFNTLQDVAGNNIIYEDSSRLEGVVYNKKTNEIWAYNNSSICIFNTLTRRKHLINDNKLKNYNIKLLENIMIDSVYGNVILKDLDKLFFGKDSIFYEISTGINLKNAKVRMEGNKLVAAGKFGVAVVDILGFGKFQHPIIYRNIKNFYYGQVYDFSVNLNQVILNTDKGVYYLDISDTTGYSLDCQKQRVKYAIFFNKKQRSIKDLDTVQILSGVNDIQLDVINPLGNGKVRYSYRIGNDSFNSNTNEINLPQVIPGKYYEVVIKVSDDVWRSAPIRLYFYAKPTFFQKIMYSRYFWPGVALIVLSFLIGLVFITRKIVNKRNQRRNMRLELELKSVHAQINPHFIYNTLGTALFFIKKNRMEEAYDHVSKFSRLLRSYMESSRSKLISIKDELQNLENYIQLQQVRFEDKFNYSILMDSDDLGEVEIPALLLQPIVENAIDHGLFHKTTVGNLTLSFKKGIEQNQVVCIIDDDGIGRKASKKINSESKLKRASYGESMIKDLVAIFNKYEKLNINIEYIDKVLPETGTTVVITIKNYANEK